MTSFLDLDPPPRHFGRRALGTRAQRGGVAVRGGIVPGIAPLACLALVPERVQPRAQAQQASVRRFDRGTPGWRTAAGSNLDLQIVDLASGQDHTMFCVLVPLTHKEAYVTFSKEGLVRLRNGLAKAGLDPRFFAWPPEHDRNRAPYRGLKPLDTEDAGDFFGRDAPIIEALDALRGLADAAPPRLFVIIGASGAGKSSFLRAGLLPRLARDDRKFLPLPVIRPERGVISGETGLLRALETTFAATGLPQTRVRLREAINGGAKGNATASQATRREGVRRHAGPRVQCQQARHSHGDRSGGGTLCRRGRSGKPSIPRTDGDLAREDQPGILIVFTTAAFIPPAGDRQGVRRHVPASVALAADAARRVPNGDRGPGRAAQSSQSRF